MEVRKLECRHNFFLELAEDMIVNEDAFSERTKLQMATHKLY